MRGAAAKILQFSNASKLSKSLAGLIKRAPQPGVKLTKQRVTKYLDQVHKVPRKQLVKDLEAIGLKKAGGSKTGEGILNDKFLKFRHKTEEIQVQIHEPHPGKNGADYPHLHIKNRHGQPLNKDLEIVNRKSPGAHIEVQDVTPKLNPEGKPQ
jgi:hypothetical protein